MEEQLTYYRRTSRRSKRMYMGVKVVQIAVGAVIPVLAATGVASGVTASMAAIPVIAEGIQQLFQWHTSWLRSRATAQALKTEKFLYAAQAGAYATTNRKTVLAERVTAITDKETAEWVTTSGDTEQPK
ncbi:DUF4231 domain-containing protein [Nocardia cyriacigeorgica]|uniref:DUF4231 domain-containing protein n=1 Tax=Nocardia cyriacigeorgica TaxID=135487 RepID=UPI001893C302|nr:DUF4231 domain-containing protein [Nocardia cyriacigeorgica]MBF6087189.1 DUF4231 domain-containing protein [Nocardia cyriacigeorgica]